jgi:hypothetical protein
MEGTLVDVQGCLSIIPALALSFSCVIKSKNTNLSNFHLIVLPWLLTSDRHLMIHSLLSGKSVQKARVSISWVKMVFLLAFALTIFLVAFIIDRIRTYRRLCHIPGPKLDAVFKLWMVRA